MNGSVCHNKGLPLLLFALAAVMLAANIWGYDLWPSDEPRFGEVAREMMVSGNYIAPQINGEPYKEKPPLLFWAIAAASAPFGDVTEFSARIPSVLAALLTLVFTFGLARRLYDARTALWACIILATSTLFWMEARSVRTDMLLTAAMTGALLAFVRWRDSKSRAALIAFYAAIAVGLFAKGPPALIFPLLLIVAYYWKQRDERRRTHWVIGLAAGIAVLLLWFVPARLMAASEPVAASPYGEGVGGEFFRMTIGRFLLGVSKAQPPWYYLINLPVGLLPWALFLPWAVPWVWRRRREDDRMRVLLAWIVPAFVFFSISIGKRSLYLLPIYPALAVVLARAVLDLMDGGRARWRRWIAAVWAALLLILASAPLALPATEYGDLWTPRMLLLTAVGVGFAALALGGAWKQEGKTLHRDMAAGFAAMTLAAVFVAFPAVDQFKGASAICAPLRALSERGQEYRLYCIGFSREEYIFYTKQFHTPVLTDLLPVELSHEISLKDMAKQQRRLRKEIAEAVADVEVADITRPTPAERDQLREVIHRAVEAAEVEPEMAHDFEQALREAVGAFMTDFDAPEPAFAFVQSSDWKWLLPLFPEDAQYSLVTWRQVGSRDVVLLANPAGAALLEN